MALNDALRGCQISIVTFKVIHVPPSSIGICRISEISADQLVSPEVRRGDISVFVAQCN